jgi:hypothetical protein
MAVKTSGYPHRRSNGHLTRGILEVLYNVSDESDDELHDFVCIFLVCATYAQKGGNSRENQLVRQGPL